MNYLSHYYFPLSNGQSENTISSYYSLGSILPDLARSYNKKWRLRKVKDKSPKGSFMSQIDRGIKDHHAVDRLFHSSAFFNEYSRLIQQKLRDSGFMSLPRHLYFIAHIMLELLLDRVLINKEDGLCSKFYLSLNSIPIHDLRAYMKRQKIIDNIDRFIDYFCQFIEKNYLFGYTDNSRFIFALNRVIMTTGNKGFMEEDYGKLEKVIFNLEKKLVNDYKKVFYEINDKM